MTATDTPRRTIFAGALASLMVAAAVPAAAVNIPEGGAVTPDSTFLFHLRVTETCDGLPMDELEVTIPEGVTNPMPESMAGWDTTIEIPGEMEEDAAEEGEDVAEEGDDAEAASEASADGGSELTVIRWDGGLLEDGRLLDFGIRARFPDEQDAVLEFPVVQRCGDVEVESAPTVTLTLRYGQGEIARIDAEVTQLRAEVDTLRADVDRLQDQVGQVNVTNLRNRVEDLEDETVALDERVTAVEEELDATEEAPAEEAPAE
jgi:uncharacterized protein YcnI